MWNTIFVAPLYNTLVLFTGWFGGHLWIAIVVLTIFVKLILSPFVYQTLRSQKTQKKLAPEIEKLRKQYPDQMIQTQKILELYKQHNAHPLSGCLPILIQIPIILALYQVFLAGITGNVELLYSGLVVPVNISESIFSISLSAKSLLFAVLAGISQFVQLRVSLASQFDSGAVLSEQEQMNKTMQTAMQYVLPVMIIGIGMAVPGAVTLYWFVSNIITIAQEFTIKRLIS